MEFGYERGSSSHSTTLRAEMGISFHCGVKPAKGIGTKATRSGSRRTTRQKPKENPGGHSIAGMSALPRE
jgi:hypothetical protein